MVRKSNRVAGVSAPSTAPSRSTRSATKIPRLTLEKNTEYEKVKKELELVKKQLAADKKKNVDSAEKHKRDVAESNQSKLEIEQTIERKGVEHRAELDRLETDRANDSEVIDQIESQAKVHGNATDNNVGLKAEKRCIADIRKKNQIISKKLLARMEEKYGESMSWRNCEICLQMYTQTGNRTPRLLICGHTLCIACCRQIAQGNELSCPYDRIITSLPENNAEKLSKNLLVLNA